LIVASANKAMNAIHDRMPVFLRRNEDDRWLSNDGGLGVLKPASEDLRQSWPVSRRLNAVGSVDGASMIEPLAA